MGIRLDCDVCGRFIRNIALKEIRNFDGTDNTCGDCKGRFDSLSKEIDKFRKKFDVKIGRLVNDAQQDLAKLISKVADGS